MKQYIVLAAIIALSGAQFHNPALDIPGVPPPPWQGPLADHINGIPPRDTPEVAAAKAALAQAYSNVLAVLPELPPEERYRSSNVPVNHVPVVPQYNHQTLHHNLGHHVQPTFSHEHQQPQTFAEEIPRSPIGEVPEVHAARVAHLKAFQEAQASLPRLAETSQHAPQHYVPPQHGLSFQNYLQNQQPQPHQMIQDTPEVAKAKADHAAAVAAALHFH